MNEEKRDYTYDKDQLKAIKCERKNILVSAGAGSGKTTTIIGRIDYLIKEKQVKEDELICISFTNKATDSLKNKLINLGYNIPCYTFHKLSLEVLQDKKYKIASEELLRYIINEYFISLINLTPDNKKRVLNIKRITYTKKNYINKYEAIKENLSDLKDNIYNSINTLKTNSIKITDLIKNEKNKRKRNYLILVLYIYIIYKIELRANNAIDFNDMIILATDKLKKENHFKNTKHIIIDEFQDTSPIRLNLIKEIINKTNANLFAVGDDFQSIYRFSGCNLDIFLNFKNYFNSSEIITLNKTYRNSKELINIAGSFIMKNKNQLKKSLTSDKSLKHPIEIVYYKNIVNSFIKLITKIYKEMNKPILVLGRNNFDIELLTKNKYFYQDKDKIIYLKNKDIVINYLTVHKAKGLEAENVIIINLTNSKNGFPSKKESYEVLNITNKKTYPFDEERRLFYVALTRTKNKVYLLVPYKNPSLFIKELKKQIKKSH